METPTLDNSKETMKEQEKISLFSGILGIFKKKQKKVLSEEEQKKQKEEKEKVKISKYKSRIEEYSKRKLAYITRYIAGGILGAILFWIIIYLSVIYTESQSNTEDFSVFATPVAYKAITIVCILSGVGFGILGFITGEVDISQAYQEVNEYVLLHTQDEAEEDPFKNSIKTSYTYLDRYYDQTQMQAKQGFAITVVIAVCGALLIFGGIITLYLGFVEPAYITCASGVITEFISSIFFAMYNKTVTSMNNYHDKLVLSQNIAFALRVADSLENNKDAAKLEIIKELMKDVNAQMMKSDNDAEPPKKKQSDAEKPSDAGTQS